MNYGITLSYVIILIRWWWQRHLGFHHVVEALSKRGGQHLDCWSSDIDLRVGMIFVAIIIIIGNIAIINYIAFESWRNSQKTSQCSQYRHPSLNMILNLDSFPNHTTKEFQNIYLLISCCQFNFWKSLRWWCSLDFGSLFNQKMVLTVSSMLNKLILMLMLMLMMLMILVILVMLINDDQLLALITLNQKVILQFSHFCFLERLINERTICFC